MGSGVGGITGGYAFVDALDSNVVDIPVREPSVANPGVTVEAAPVATIAVKISIDGRSLAAP